MVFDNRRAKKRSIQPGELRKLGAGGTTAAYGIEDTNKTRGVVLKDYRVMRELHGLPDEEATGFSETYKKDLEEGLAALRSTYGEFIPPTRFIRANPDEVGEPTYFLLQSRIDGKSAFTPTVLDDEKQRADLRKLVDANVEQMYRIINAEICNEPCPDATMMDFIDQRNLVQETKTGKFYYIDSGYESPEHLYTGYHKDGIQALYRNLETLFYLAVRSGMTLQELDPNGDFYGVYFKHPQIEGMTSLSQQELLTHLHQLFRIQENGPRSTLKLPAQGNEAKNKEKETSESIFHAIRWDNVQWERKDLDPKTGHTVFEAHLPLPAPGKEMQVEMIRDKWSDGWLERYSLTVVDSSGRKSIYGTITVNTPSNGSTVSVATSIDRLDRYYDDAIALPKGSALVFYEKMLDMIQFLSDSNGKDHLHTVQAVPKGLTMKEWNAKFASLLSKRGYKELADGQWEKRYTPNVEADDQAHAA